MTSVALVTGASGYLGSHCVKTLLEAGYRVRGTVRSLKNAKKVDPVRALDSKGHLELVEADLLRAETWPGALVGVDHVLHVASPFVLNPDESTIKTAVEGTMNVLRAAAKQPSVKKVVLTSSVVAIFEGHDWATKTFNETIWSKTDNTENDYAKSKTFAEKAAWDFHASLPKESRFALSVINPSFIIGPLLTDDEGTSVTLVKWMMEKKYPAVPALDMTCVDVRDVAAAHLRALELPASDGERFILSGDRRWFKEMTEILAKEFEPQGYCISVRNAPYPLLWLLSFFDKAVKPTLPRIGKRCQLDNSKSKTVLGVQYRELEKSLLEMAYSLVERGIVKKGKKYQGVPFGIKLD